MPGDGDAGRRRVFGLALVAVFLVAVALRGAAVWALGSPLESDELAYHSMAQSLLAGQGIVDFMGNRAMYNVGYPLLLMAPVYAVVGESVPALQAVQVLLGGVTALAVGWLAREAGASRGAAVLAAGAWAVYVPALLMPESVLKENLQVPLMLLAVGLALRLARGAGWRTALGCGAVFGLLALVGNSALSLALAVALALLLAPTPWTRKLAFALAMAMVTVAVAAPWMLRNRAVLGAPVLNTNGGFNLYLGNNPAADGGFVSIAATPLAADWEGLRRGGEVAASQRLRDEAVAWALANPARVAELVLVKAGLFWSPPVAKADDSRAAALARQAWAWQFVLLSLAAVAAVAMLGLRLVRRAVPWRGAVPALVLLAAVAGYFAAHLPFYVMPRYREPVMPFVIALAALAASAAMARWRGR